MVKILGINHDMYITSAALLIDGKIVAACAEERFNRVKLSRSFPHNAIKYCLKSAKININDLDFIANSYNPSSHLNKFNPIFSRRRDRSDYLYSVPDNLLNLYSERPQDSEYTLQVHKLDDVYMNLYFINHHLCHAANGYFLSSFDNASILTVDGRGETDTATFCVGLKNKINTYKKMKIPHSIGSFYSTFTSFLGFQPDCDEWKVMALSSYGNKSNKYYHKIRNLIELKNNGFFELDINYFNEIIHEMPNYFTEKFIEEFGIPRKKDSEFNSRHYEIAAAMQQVTEDVLLHMCDNLYKDTKKENLVLSGGSIMNSVFNGKVIKKTKFKNLFISSAPDDSGLSIGACLALYNTILGKNKRFEQIHNFYGPSYTNGEIKKILKNLKIKFIYSNNIEKEAALAISKGKLIGWFQGKMEFGQRALGNRSILADPRNKNMKDKINKAIKYRESFRPFAPAILIDDVREFFETSQNEKVPFMEKVLMIKKSKQKLIPAVTHKDGSGRLQTVTKKENTRFYNLINEFKKITNVPILLNTSFNANNEPIVCSPNDAIRNFYSCGLDILVLENFMIFKNEK